MGRGTGPNARAGFPTKLDAWRADEKLPARQSRDRREYRPGELHRVVRPAKRSTSTPASTSTKTRLIITSNCAAALGLVVKKDEPVSIDEMGEIMKNANADYLAISANAHDNSYWAVNQAAGKLYAAGGARCVVAVVSGWAHDPVRFSAHSGNEQAGIYGVACGPGSSAGLRTSHSDRAQSRSEATASPVGIKWQEEFLRPANPTPPEAAEALGWVGLPAQPSTAAATAANSSRTRAQVIGAPEERKCC